MSELKSTHARYASSLLVSALDVDRTSTRDADRDRAALKLGEFVTSQDVTRWQNVSGPQSRITVPEMMADECVKVLQTAPITLNFEPYKWFAQPLTKNNVLSIWNLIESKPPGYANFREGAEKTIFGFDDVSKSVKGVNIGVEIAKYGSTGGMSEGKPSNPDFVPEARPKYAAINFTWALCGAAPDYGLSHLILANYVRFNCTFTHRDSFGVGESGRSPHTTICIQSLRIALSTFFGRYWTPRGIKRTAFTVS